MFGGRVDSSGNIKTEHDRRIWKNPYPLQATFWSRIGFPQRNFLNNRDSSNVSNPPKDASKGEFKCKKTADEPTLYADNTHISIARNLKNNPFQLSGYTKDQWHNTIDEAYFYKQRIKSCREWKVTKGGPTDASACNYLVRDASSWVKEKSNNYTTPVVRVTILHKSSNPAFDPTQSDFASGQIKRQFYFRTNATNMGKIQLKLKAGFFD